MSKALKWDVTHEAKVIGLMQKSINKRGAELQKHRAILAASCVLHMIKVGNATPMTTFVNNLPADARADSVVKWAINTGLFKAGTVTIDGKKSNIFKKADDAVYDAAIAKHNENPKAYVDNLVDVNAWVFDPPKDPFKGLNGTARVHALVKQMKDTMNDATKAGHKDNDFSIFADLEALAAKYKYVPKKGGKKATAAADAEVAASIVAVH